MFLVCSVNSFPIKLGRNIYCCLTIFMPFPNSSKRKSRTGLNRNDKLKMASPTPTNHLIFRSLGALNRIFKAFESIIRIIWCAWWRSQVPAMAHVASCCCQWKICWNCIIIITRSAYAANSFAPGKHHTKWCTCACVFSVSRCSTLAF